MFTTKTKIDIEVQRELSKKSYNIAFVAMIIGAIGLLAYIIVGTIYELPILDIMLIFAIPFAFGLVYMIAIKKLLKKVEEIDSVNEYTFNETFFEVNTIRNGESVGSAKIYYKELYKSKETINFVFMYLNKTAAIAVAKKNLTSDELIILRSLLNLELMPKGM